MDLFENLNFVPAGVAKLAFQMGNEIDDRGLDYFDLEQYKQQFKNMGYIFEYGLDAVPFNLKKL